METAYPTSAELVLSLQPPSRRAEGRAPPCSSSADGTNPEMGSCREEVECLVKGVTTWRLPMLGPELGK